MNPDAFLKDEIRRAVLARRATLPAPIRGLFAERLVYEGHRIAKAQDVRRVSAYYPFREEPDTLPMLAALADDGFETALPCTVSRNDPLIFRLWRPGDPTIRGQLRIPEPPSEAPVVEPELLFTPLAAFDRQGNRIGYGAGHYDRTLARLRAKRPTIAIGVAFSACEVEAIPAEPHDQPLQYILTESDLIVAKVA